ncbi:F-box only 33-like, partial [Schistosoma japonicum]
AVYFPNDWRLTRMALDFDSVAHTWSFLPYHIVKHIYSYLGNDVIHVSTVSKHWRNVAYSDRSLWRKLFICPFNFPKVEAFKNPIVPIRICSEIFIQFDPMNEFHATVLEYTLNVLCLNPQIHSISLRPTLKFSYKKSTSNTLNQFSKKVINALCEVIMNAKCLKNFYWGGTYCSNYDVSRVLQSLKNNQKHNLLSLQIIRLLQINQSMSYLNTRLFIFSNLSQFSINYLHLSEDILLILSKNSNHLRILKLFVQNSVQDLPIIRNQIWRHVHEILPNFRVTLFLICVSDLKQSPNSTNQQMSFISNTTQELDNQLQPAQQPTSSYSSTSSSSCSVTLASSTSSTFSSSSYIPVQHQQGQEREHVQHLEYGEQNQLYQLLSTKLLPSALPLNSIYIYYCKPNPLSYLIQYLMDTFSMSLEHFYLIDTFNTISVMSNISNSILYDNISHYTKDITSTTTINNDNNSNNSNTIRFIANTPTATTVIMSHDSAIDYDNYDCVDSDYQSMFSSYSSYHSLLLDSTSDFDILSCDSSYDLFDHDDSNFTTTTSNNNTYYSGNLLLPVSTNLSLTPSLSVPVPGSFSTDQIQQLSVSPISPRNENDHSSIIISSECNENASCTPHPSIASTLDSNSIGLNKTNIITDHCDYSTYDRNYYSQFSEGPQLSPLCPSSPSNLIFYSPNLYKALDDVNPDPFVMLAWRCQQLSHFTLIGYWFNIVDMKAFTALRGTSLKSFHIPSCCISIDDQSWPFNLNENLNEMSRSVGYKWVPLQDLDLPSTVWNQQIPDAGACFYEIQNSCGLDSVSD